METVSREQVNYRQVRGEEMGTEDCELKGTDAGGRRGEDVRPLRVRGAADPGSLSTLFSVLCKVSVK